MDLYGPNVNTDDVRPYLAGTNLSNPTFNVGEYIGQSNGGMHASLFGEGSTLDPAACSGGSSHTNVANCLSGKDIIVPIVSPAGVTCTGGENGGCFEGWAMFHVTSATKHGNKSTVNGYFISGFTGGGEAEGDICVDRVTCKFHGLYALKLIN